MCRFKLFLAATATLMLAGCWKPSEKGDLNNGKSDESATASFGVTEIHGEIAAPKPVGLDATKVWRLAQSKEVLVTACLQDRRASGSVKGQKFSVEIVEEQRRIQLDPSDKKSCIVWREVVPYNPLAEKPGYIEVKRRIHAEGAHVGFKELILGINPWAGERGDTSKPVIWLKTGKEIAESYKIKSADSAQALAGKLPGDQAQLWMSEVSPLITYKDEQDAELRLAYNKLNGRVEKGIDGEAGALLEVLLSMRPTMRVEKLDGNPFSYPIQSGAFNVHVSLYAANTGTHRNERHLLTPITIPAVGKIIDGRLEVAVNMGLSRRLTRGRLEMAVMVEPAGLDKKLTMKPFEAVFVLGDVTKVIGSASAKLSPEVYKGEKPFSYSEFMKSAQNFKEIQDRVVHANAFEPFIYETASVMFAGVRPGETATKRTMDYKVTSCVRDTLTGERVQNQPFYVYDEDGKEIKILKEKKLPNEADEWLPMKTSQEGCLIWTSSVTHQYYHPEEFFFPVFKIRHPRTQAGKESLKQLVINPWDAMFRTFGFDRIEFTQQFIDSVRNRKKIPSRMFVPRYSYHAIRFRYEIDRFMELEVKKQVLLNLRPQVLRYSGIVGGRRVTESLRDGIWLMKVAIQKDYLDPADKGVFLRPSKTKDGKYTTAVNVDRKLTPRHFVTVVKKLVRVNDGEINTPVEFSMQDLRLMRIRAQFLVQLEPVDENQLQVANILGAQMKRQLVELETKRAMTDNEKRAKIIEDRENLQKAVAKIRAELIKHKVLKVGQLQNLQRAEEEAAKLAGQPFVKIPGFDISSNVEAEILEALKVNDFTITTTAPIVDLDTLIEKDTGLERRSFVGPIIFLSNAYSDDLRPTDNLDEANCEVTDCDELKTRDIEGKQFRNNYDTSPFFGSIAHLATVQVDDLIKEYRRGQEVYRVEMPNLSSIANYARLYNMKFISLGGEKATITDPNCKGSSDKCQVPAGEFQLDANSLLSEMNSEKGELGAFRSQREFLLSGFRGHRFWKAMPVNQPVGMTDWMKLAASGDITPAMGDRLCRMFASHIAKAMGRRIDDLVIAAVFRQCFIPTMQGEGRAPFWLDTKLRVSKTGEYVFKGGKQMNLNVGSNFGLSHSTSFSIGAGFNLMELPLFGMGLNRMLGSNTAGSFLKPFSLKMGVDTSRSQSDGTSISESTYLVMQMASFAIQLKEYERCTIVKLNLKVVADAEHLPMFGTPEQRQAVHEAIHRGLFVCTGKKDDKPLAVTESYYYFTQHFTEGDMLDQADLYNHPWLLAMRGVRDFANFARLIRAQEFTLLAPFTKVVDKPGWALDQMVDTYRRVQPTFPGLYTPHHEDEGLKEYPADQNPSEAFIK